VAVLCHIEEQAKGELGKLAYGLQKYHDMDVGLLNGFAATAKFIILKKSTVHLKQMNYARKF